MADSFPWLCLNHVPGLGPRGVAALLEVHGDAAAILAAGRRGKLGVDGVRGDARTALRSGTYEAQAEADARRAVEVGVTVVPLPDLPAGVRALADPPPVLYVAGDLLPRDGVAIAVVGSRAATRYGLHVATALARDLAGRGATIVSGLATGIDAAAHDGALAAGGRTLAVLGCGVDVVYPAGSEARMAAIRDAGALLSEHPMGTRPRGGFFPRRNRIIATLAVGTVVVEAQERSGALITARLAGELGREVFAVPGNVTSSRSVGANRLIQQGALLVQSGVDVVSALPPAVQGYLQPPPRAARAAAHTSGLARRVLAALADSERRVDELVALTQTGVSALLAELTQLELKGLIRQTDGGGYITVDSR
ncbi:MAG: DNA-processing protein DprA [Nitrospirota bacterium]|jgi:DNA processing protein